MLTPWMIAFGFHWQVWALTIAWLFPSDSQEHTEAAVCSVWMLYFNFVVRYIVFRYQTCYEHSYPPFTTLLWYGGPCWWSKSLALCIFRQFLTTVLDLKVLPRFAPPRISLSDGRKVEIEKKGEKLKLSYIRTMKAKLEDVTVATDGFQCRQLRWEDGNVWSWVNPAKVQADLKAAVDKLKESEAEVASLHLDMNQIQRQMDLWEISSCLSLYFVGEETQRVLKKYG